MALDIDLIASFFSCVIIGFSIILGILIIRKYIETKEKAFITVGLTWIFITSNWWTSATVIFLKIFYPDTPLEQTVNNLKWLQIFVAIAFICWVYSFCELVYPKWTKKGMIIFSPITIFYVISALFYFYGPDDYFTFFMVSTFLCLIIFIAIFIITGYLFYRKSNMSKEPKVRWKGRFLFIAFISFSVVSILEIINIWVTNVVGTWNPTVFSIFTRILVILCGIEYYLGFFLPDRISNWLIKK